MNGETLLMKPKIIIKNIFMKNLNIKCVYLEY